MQATASTTARRPWRRGAALQLHHPAARACRLSRRGLGELTDRYRRALMQASPDFQVAHGYADTRPGQGQSDDVLELGAESFESLR